MSAYLDLARALVKLGYELPKALYTELRGEPFEYESRTSRPAPPEAQYRFIREFGNKVSQGGLGLGYEVVALELRVPVTLVRDSSMPEGVRVALQQAAGELYDQARTTLRKR